jgi:hypothetical protein
MAKQFLDSANIVAGFEEMGGKGMPETMTTRMLQHPGTAHRRLGALA